MPLPFEKAPLRASVVLEEPEEVVGEDGWAAAGRPRTQSDPQAKPTRNTKSSNPKPMENHGDADHSAATGPTGQRAAGGQPGFASCAPRSRSRGPQTSATGTAALASQ